MKFKAVVHNGWWARYSGQGGWPGWRQQAWPDSMYTKVPFKKLKQMVRNYERNSPT